jgi:hypothetical protein
MRFPNICENKIIFKFQDAISANLFNDNVLRKTDFLDLLCLADAHDSKEIAWGTQWCRFQKSICERNEIVIFCVSADNPPISAFLSAFKTTAVLNLENVTILFCGSEYLGQANISQTSAEILQVARPHDPFDDSVCELSDDLRNFFYNVVFDE